jgi:metallophosphoesterase superfamily enzyme
MPQKPYFRKQIHSPYFASQIRGKYGKSVAVNTFVYLIQHYVIEFDKWLVVFPGLTPVSSSHDITEILLEVALTTITLTLI